MEIKHFCWIHLSFLRAVAGVTQMSAVPLFFSLSSSSLSPFILMREWALWHLLRVSWGRQREDWHCILHSHPLTYLLRPKNSFLKAFLLPLHQESPFFSPHIPRAIGFSPAPSLLPLPTWNSSNYLAVFYFLLNWIPPCRLLLIADVKNFWARRLIGLCNLTSIPSGRTWITCWWCTWLLMLFATWSLELRAGLWDGHICRKFLLASLCFLGSDTAGARGQGSGEWVAGEEGQTAEQTIHLGSLLVKEKRGVGWDKGSGEVCLMGE